MNLGGYLRMAFDILVRDALRSALTIGGIVIGVSSVILMTSIGAGALLAVEKQISSLGTNILLINPSPLVIGGRPTAAGANLPLTEDDVTAIKLKVAGAAATSGQLWASATIVRGNTAAWTFIWGVHDQYVTARSWSIEAGRDLSRDDIENSRRVILMGKTVARVIFGEDDPVGHTVRIRNVPFAVVGTLKSKGRTSFGGDQDDVVLMPMTVARRQVIGKGHGISSPVGQISVRFEENVDLADAKEEVEQVMRQSRRVQIGADDNFVVGDMTEALQARSAALKTLSRLLGLTATISLLVGGLGIMNMMLVSIGERTREIGLRMAVGARPFDIGLQFLIEAMAMTFIGGLVGCALGALLAYFAAETFAWPVIVSPVILLLGIGAAAGTGLVFGLLPALRAAALQPVAAMRGTR